MKALSTNYTSTTQVSRYYSIELSLVPPFSTYTSLPANGIPCKYLSLIEILRSFDFSLVTLCYQLFLGNYFLSYLIDDN